MILKKTSILTKVILLAGLTFFVGLVYFFFIQKLNFWESENMYSIQILERNNLEVNNVAYLTSRILNQDKAVKEEATNKITVIDFSYTALKNGGFPPKMVKKRLLQSANSGIVEETENVIKIWVKLKSSFQTIINEPLHNHIRSKKDTIINGEEREVFVTKVIINPMINRADIFIKQNIGILLSENKKIILYYENKNLEYARIKNVSLFVLIVVNILAFVLAFVYAKRNIFDSITITEKNLKNILRGNSIIQKNIKNIDLEGINSNVFSISQKMDKITEFATNLQHDQLETHFENEEEDDKLKNALINLREKLKATKEAEILRDEREGIRKWGIEGHAKFNEIMRKAAANLPELADSVIKNIVLFLDASQGGLYIVNDNNPKKIFLEQFSTFAYDRKKYIQHSIEIGEGLVGQCALEGNTIYLTKIPENYMEIESGLGNATPKSLIIVPLKTDEDLLGVIEIASFKEMQQHEADFLEKFGQSLAATLKTTKISERTSRLLAESQKSSEELEQREENMKLKILDLQTMQAEAKNNEIEMTGIISAINKSLLKAEYSVEGKFISANRMFLHELGYHFEELSQLTLFDFLDISVSEKEIENFMIEIKRGNVVEKISTVQTKYENKISLLGKYTPIFGEQNKLKKILFIANDITNLKNIEIENIEQLLQKNKEIEKLVAEKTNIQTQIDELIAKNISESNQAVEAISVIKAIDISIIKAEYNPRGTLISANQKFINTFDDKIVDIENKNIRDFIPKEDIEDFEQIWQNLYAGKQFSGIRKRKNTKGEIFWLKVTYTPVFNAENLLMKIVFMASDISEIIQDRGKITQLENQLAEKDKKIEQLSSDLENKNKNKDNQKDEKIFEEHETEKDKVYKKWIDNLRL